MTPVSREQLAQEIHAQPTHLVLAATGGGSRAISSLVSVAGASRTILAAHVPYAAAALVEWLGGKPDEFCSSWTARSMAMRAFLDARRLDPNAPVMGLACTASLASDRPKRGPHRAHFAAQTANTTTAWSIELTKGFRSRNDEEELVADLFVNLVAEATGVSDRLNVTLSSDERLIASTIAAPADQQDLLAGRLNALCVGCPVDVARPRAVLPGAFHPLHQGHRQMAAIAGELLGCSVAFEISIVNVDKPPLDYLEIAERAGQFASGEQLWLTRAPLYVEKSKLFPGATFVVGADTIARIGEPRYYGSAEAMQQAIGIIAGQGCRFLVFGRRIGDSFRSLGDLSLSEALARLCQEVPESRFHVDLSSTELRQAGQANPTAESG